MIYTKLLLLISLKLSLSFFIFSQDSTQTKKTKKGWTFGALPAIAYDTDIGFKYGGLVNFYDYGDGSTYPEYKHSLYFEWSRTTKGSGINQFTYDSKYLIPNVRVSAEASYLTEQAIGFYGFNGYQSYYNANYINDEHPDYISRLYYMQQRKLARIKCDFQGKTKLKSIQWYAGFSYYGVMLDTVDVNKLNKGKNASDKLPYTQGGLYGQYIRWGLIPEGQADGGESSLIRLGTVFDTRDNEPNPMKGHWTDIQFIIAPKFINKSYPFVKLAITHRSYYTLIPEILNFAGRISYQGKISGQVPAYMLPFIFSLGRSLDRDGLGGAKTLRGILRNRIVGEDILYGNIELRWKFYRGSLFKQNFYMALSTFYDGGGVIKDYKLLETSNNETAEYFAKGQNESIHSGLGAGLHFALNENFVVAIDYGHALNKNDGDDGLYIGLNFLF